MDGELSVGHTGASILIVEDDPSSRQALAELLADDGYEVTTANDGLAGIAAVERAVPSLIISDVNMPRRDGFELVRELRARPASARVPILLLSAVAEPSRRAAGLDLGADDFLLKPVDFGELLARIRVLLRRGREREEIERRATIDPLTGVLNRLGLDEALRHERMRSLRTETPLSILMIDLDRFKQLNDEHGHPAGDAALVRVAESLVSAVRKSDYVGRYGGDEFLVILPGSTDEAAAALAARLRKVRLPELPLGDGREHFIQISIGEATLTPSDTLETLVARADHAMYRVKRISQSPLPRSDPE